MNIRVGFWGYGKYCRALSERIRSIAPELRQTFFDPFIDITSLGHQAVQSHSLCGLVENIDVLIIGLPTIVSETAKNLLALRLYLDSIDQALRPKLLVGYDALPLEEIFFNSPIEICSIMYGLVVSQGESPIAIRAINCKSPEYGDFITILKLASRNQHLIVVHSYAEILLGRLLIGAGLILPSLIGTSGVTCADTISSFLRQLDKRGLTHVVKSFHDALDVIANSLTESAARLPSEHSVLVSMLSHTGGYTNSIYDNWKATGDLVLSLENTFINGVRDALASSIHANSCHLESFSIRYSDRQDFPVSMSREIARCSTKIMDLWQPFVAWFNVYDPRNAKQIHFGKFNQTADTIFQQYFGDSSTTIGSMSQLLTEAKTYDTNIIIQLTNGEDDYSGRYHLNVSGVHVIRVPITTNPPITPEDPLKCIREWKPDTRVVSILHTQLIPLLGIHVHNNDSAEKLLRYIAVLGLAYPNEQWDNAMFLPAGKSGELQRALYVGGKLDFGHPISTSLTHFANIAFGLLLERQAYAASCRAARAAVFARNFSHIIGSHVISRPEFRSALVGGSLMNKWRDGLRKAHRDFVSAENNLYANMLECGVNPEELWSNGTKVLDQANSDLRIGGVLTENTRRFHEYLQGRFDFIARAIDLTTDQPEPLWFVEDLIEGFLSQTAFLDNLVADIGLRRDKMRFSVIILDGERKSPRFTAIWKENDKTGFDEIKWEADRDTTSEDIRNYAVMVALPGGMVSAHALYSLLENIIRNSAKYGSLKENANHGYELNLELKRKSDHFTLKIWDNFSGNEKAIWIQTKLERDFVKAGGEQESDALGMLEMQACAGLLCRSGDDERYPSRDKLNLRVASKDKPETCPDGEALLTFILCLNAPILLGILKSDATQGNRKLTRHHGGIKDVEKRWPHILVMDGLDCKLSEWLDDIRKEHWKYPFRVVVLSGSTCPTIQNDWHKENDKEVILKRRVVFLSCDELHKKVFKPIAGTDMEIKQAEVDAILSVYEAWLRAWKGCDDTPEIEKRWHLWIGMDRSHQQVRDAWNEQVSSFNSTFIQLVVRSFQNGKTETIVRKGIKLEGVFPSGEKAYWDTERDAEPSRKQALVFDNHGNCFLDSQQFENKSDFRSGPRFFQKFTGSLTPDLFRALSRPPKDEFAFAFFIHSLVEACLTNVMVVDERVAWNLVEGKSAGSNHAEFSRDLASHQKAGVFPIFRFRQHGAADDCGYYNHEHRNSFLACVRGSEPSVNHEGVIFSEKDGNSMEVLVPTTETDFGTLATGGDFLDCDILLIHEGALDLLTDKQGVNWENDEGLASLFQLASAVVRTSGRGRTSKHLGEHLPFIEFGEVSSALLTSRNKFSLVRGLLGSAGHEKMKP